ncbi:MULTISPECIES: metallophosphoesterase [unclassified Modicisalibacter]|uniref:metallophosphoesterase n=1 Tax=unclassified Modicisalibacter TaxID=2679913 RepID=UPI001CCE4C3D|nr:MULTISPECIES: metallophosphoesterase [unclassified Modicisalibacter]MBZ9560083.1 metallophosphoesterase [Modicisalibacter sp. R2A 31.J]MBZ9575992.1 metallophosphoesterase [Modicisalibacter sp. MOD 31.J]
MSMTDGIDGYDLIGDVHGCGATLAALLEKLDYRREGGVYRHPRRKAIFLGDLIDRGPRIRLAVSIARRMVEAGEAHIVMGNHEINALAYNRRCPSGSSCEWLREHTPRHNRIIRETLEQYRHHPGEWEDALAWFMTIPLVLEIDGLRVVHACWDAPLIRRFLARHPSGRIDEAFLAESADSGSFAFRVLERLTRGTHLRLPEGVEIHSGDGFTRRTFRAHFWAREPRTYGDVVFQPDNLPGDLETQPLSEAELASLPYYGPDEPPLFLGHYWCEGVPALPAPNIACLDYSAVKFGRLVAYRWDGEATLDADKFVWLRVPRDERARPRPWEIDLD